MPFVALITLTTAGLNTGPFDLYSDVDGYTVPFETGVTRDDLVAGYITGLVPNGTTIVRVQSGGLCDNYIDLTLPPRQNVCLYVQADAGTNTITVVDNVSGEIYTLDGGDPQQIQCFDMVSTHDYTVQISATGVGPYEFVYGSLGTSFSLVGYTFPGTYILFSNYTLDPLGDAFSIRSV